jgi:hypothetical protein
MPFVDFAFKTNAQTNFWRRGGYAESGKAIGAQGSLVRRKRYSLR